MPSWSTEATLSSAGKTVKFYISKTKSYHLFILFISFLVYFTRINSNLNTESSIHVIQDINRKHDLSSTVAISKVHFSIEYKILKNIFQFKANSLFIVKGIKTHIETSKQFDQPRSILFL